MLDNTKNHTQLSVMLALLKANILVELLAFCNLLLALAAIMYAPQCLVKIIASSAVLAGFCVLYFAIRIRIDYVLFLRWDTLDSNVLDVVLKQVNPQHQAGKTLEARLAGAYQLFLRGLYALIIQFGLLLITAWLFLPIGINSLH